MTTQWVLLLDFLPLFFWCPVSDDGKVYFEKAIPMETCPHTLLGVTSVSMSEDEVSDWIVNNIDVLEKLVGHKFIVDEPFLRLHGYGQTLFDLGSIINAAITAEAFGLFEDEEGALLWLENSFPDGEVYVVSAFCHKCMRAIRIPYVDKGKAVMCPFCRRKLAGESKN